MISWQELIYVCLNTQASPRAAGHAVGWGGPYKRTRFQPTGRANLARISRAKTGGGPKRAGLARFAIPRCHSLMNLGRVSGSLWEPTAIGVLVV